MRLPDAISHRERLARTEDKMRGLVDFIATGDRSEYVVSTLRDLEAFTRQERAALAELEQASREPLRLPSIDEVCAQVADLDARLTDDPELGRAALRRWLNNGVIRVDQSPDGPMAETELLPLMVLIDGGEKASTKSGSPRKREVPGESSFSRDFRLLSVSSGGPLLSLAALPLPIRFAA